MLRVFCLFGLVSGVVSLDCNFTARLDCSRYPENIICGSDGRDYASMCLFAKANCLDPNIHIQAAGNCASNGYVPSTSGITEAPLFEGHNAVKDFFCLEMMHEICPSSPTKVCGSDGVTYDSFCEFQKQQCSHDGLTKVKDGQC